MFFLPLMRCLVHLRDVLPGLHRPQVEHVERQKVGQHGGTEVHGAEALGLRVACLVDMYHFAPIATSHTLQGTGDDEALATSLIDEVLPACPDVGLDLQAITALELSKPILLSVKVFLRVARTHRVMHLVSVHNFFISEFH